MVTIKSFRHAGLEEMFGGNPRKIEGSLRKRVANRLAVLEAADSLEALNIPGFHLHELKGDRKGTWAIKVSSNWRITFYFEDGNVHDANLEDYHNE